MISKRPREDDVTIDIHIDGTDVDIDRNFSPLFEGQNCDVSLVFHLTDSESASWSEMPARVVNIILADSVYSAHHLSEDNTFVIPKHMIKEGDMRFLLRGYEEWGQAEYEDWEESEKDIKFIEVNNFDNEIAVHARRK